jgi:hypothetical protein
LTNDLFTACHEISWKKLDELILNVLYKVEFCCTISAHDEHGKETMRLLDAWVDHFHENVRVIIEFYHQLLRFLHGTEAIFIH